MSQGDVDAGGSVYGVPELTTAARHSSEGNAWGSPRTHPAASRQATYPGARLKVLTCGAGVIGSLYAAKLQRAGHRVIVLARAERLTEVRRQGLVLEEFVTGERTVTEVETIERLNPEEAYDLALITVRRDQLAALVADIATNRSIPTLLFLLNNPAGFSALAPTLARGRVLLGFPEQGGRGRAPSFAIP
jgi:ketopantoate reductase